MIQIAKLGLVSLAMVGTALAHEAQDTADFLLTPPEEEYVPSYETDMKIAEMLKYDPNAPGQYNLPYNADKPCVLHQYCERKNGESQDAPCPSTSEIYKPIGGQFATAKLNDPDSFKTQCPFMDSTAPMCCTDDQVDMIKDNFATLNGVFGKDCPICAVNMKIMWCEYTCNPKQGLFTVATGEKMDTDVNHECTLVTINLDPGMACDMFNSCKKTSYISQLQLSSS
jgi:hypothetical protein